MSANPRISIHQGSIIALTNEEGQIAERITYDGHFGEIMEHTQHEVTHNPYGYTGREMDTLRLYYYRARYYSPILRRFLSPDPIEHASGDYNWYRYVGNDPVNFVDPSGLQVKLCSRWLGGPSAWDSWKINPLRHDYLVINNKEIFSFQAGKENGWYSFLWSKGHMETKGEKVNRDSCEVIWKGNEHDKYVRDEANKIKKSKPQYGIGPQATDCQEVAADIISKAREKYKIDHFLFDFLSPPDSKTTIPYLPNLSQ